MDVCDKFVTCKNCPDRTVEPNCHMTCEGYIFRCEKTIKLREEKKKEFRIRKLQTRFNQEDEEKTRNQIKSLHVESEF